MVQQKKRISQLIINIKKMVKRKRKVTVKYQNIYKNLMKKRKNKKDKDK